MYAEGHENCLKIFDIGKVMNKTSEYIIGYSIQNSTNIV